MNCRLSAKSVITVVQLWILLLSLFQLSALAMRIEPETRGIAKTDELESRIHPIIHHSRHIDTDVDGIQDSLEDVISQTYRLNQSATVPVIVTLYNQVSNEDVDFFLSLGGRLTQVYHFVTYGFAGVIPARNVYLFARMEADNLCIIEYDAPIRYHLDLSVPLIRARPVVWNTYGYLGDPDHSIAILDTGIDDSHPDIGPFGNLNFSRKFVGWYDATADNSLTPEDFGEHGTHVAGIAVGTGAANALQGSGNVQATFTYKLPQVNYGYPDYIDVKDPGVISLSVTWGGGNTVALRLDNPAGTPVKQVSGSGQPLTLSYSTVGTQYPTGRYRVVVFNLRGPSGTPFSCVETYSYEGLNDGYNLFTGVAPDSKLVGVKVFNNAGSGSSSTITAAMDWIVANRIAYRIIVASMSLGLENGAVDSTLDQKVDTMVKSGIVTTVSAGNNYPSYTIGSPGTAAYAITVAATNDENGITGYSSNGDTSKNEYGLIKPDVAAPGGTFNPQYGNLILSADSNDVDFGYSGFSDQSQDDYQQMGGTSMSAPHVAGLASLIVQAFGGWGWTMNEALKVKMIIGMTCFEVQSGEGSNVPPLNRGEKDGKEGYGRINADAAIEAAALTYNVGDSVTSALSSQTSGKKVWARQVSLSTENTYQFHLSVPSGADYDLYLYKGVPDSYGQPVISKRSVNASIGTDEAILYTPEEQGTYYLVVKWVSGSGDFVLQSSASPIRNVAITSVLLPVTETYAGRVLDVFVVADNKGGVTENFEVTLYYDNQPIETQVVSGLEPNAETTLTFAWNTKDVATYVSYTVKAVASQVPGEINVTDNIYVNGDVALKMPGDVNNDRTVNIMDLAAIARALGTDSSWPSGTGWNEWNPECDINADEKVNIFDLTIAGKNYGVTSP